MMEQGWVHLRGALSPDEVAPFVTQLTTEMTVQRVCPDPTNRDVWPSELRAHRIFELAPQGRGHSHWESLQHVPALAAVLNELLGAGHWRLPLNAAGSSRHWYCPVSFPERPLFPVKPCQCPSVSTSGDHRATRPCPFHAALDGRDEPPASPCALWAPVSRRRWVGRGWHLDVGPEFGNHEVRTLAGDYRQGLVVLILLSDSAPGCGGTAVLSGSHKWVHQVRFETHVLTTRQVSFHTYTRKYTRAPVLRMFLDAHLHFECGVCLFANVCTRLNP
jgi:hypothetical protein